MDEKGHKILEGEVKTPDYAYRGEYYLGENGGCVPHGQGIYFDRHKGDAYVGVWTEGKLQGKGAWHKRTGYGFDFGGGGARFEELYEGDFKDTLPSGNGTWWSSSDKPKVRRGRCEKYIGEWKESKKHGTGTYEYRRLAVSRYIGQWADDKENGFGTLTFETDYIDNLRDENGKIVYDEKAKSGKDKFPLYIKYPAGTAYIGEWKNGKMHGRGKLVKKDGAILLEGTFTDGKFDGKEVL